MPSLQNVYKIFPERTYFGTRLFALTFNFLGESVPGGILVEGLALKDRPEFLVGGCHSRNIASAD